MNVNDVDVQHVIIDREAYKLTTKYEKVKMLFRKLSELPGLPISANEITPDKLENALNQIALAADNDVLNEQEKLQIQFEHEEEELRDDAASKSVEYSALLQKLGMTPIEHLINLSGWLAASEERNIAAGVLALTSTIWHCLPIWVQIIGAAGSGKSIIEESIIDIVPEEKIIEGESTRAAIFEMLDEDPNALDGNVMSLGDMGSEKDLERNLDLFNLAKTLYTDKKGHTRRKMEKIEKNGPNELIIQRITGKCSILFSTVHELKDTQHVSRMLSINPVDDGESYDKYCMYLDTHTNVKVKRDEIIKEVELVKGMIRHYGYLYKDLKVDVINPYNKVIINWTNTLPNTKRVREQVKALLKVMVLFNNNEEQRYVLPDGRIVYIISKKDILVLNELFRMNIGISVEATNFYKWITSKNRKGEVRVKPLDDDEYEQITMAPEYKSRFLSLFTVKSIRNKVNPKQRHFDRKDIPEYCNQLVDVGLIKVLAHDRESNLRIMGLNNYGEGISGNIPFRDEDVWDYLDEYLSDHAWLDEAGFKWMHDFITNDIAYPENGQVLNVLNSERSVPWAGVLA